jgi:superfamily I DNA and RNA helicase
MLQNKEHWEDLGYTVLEGTFTAGSHTVIERPAEYSLKTISQNYRANQMVEAKSFTSWEEETDYVAKQIREAIDDHLRPDDIMVAVVDDRQARFYLNSIAEKLSKLGIQSNNIHADPYGIKDFYKEGHVTLSTVHKAKGNEAFMVYVVGVDALFASYAGPRERNMLFSAMTRAKGWVKLTGVGPQAEVCKQEIEMALSKFPNLVFEYPSEQDLKIMKRDLEDKAAKKLEAERALELAMDEMSPAEIANFIKQRAIHKGKRIYRRRSGPKK